MRRLLLGITFAIAWAAGTAAPAPANVSLKNGNFFMSYTDIVYPGGFEPKLERVYNSKSSYLGMFGWGWGNEFDVYLTVSADGSVVVHEYGGGAQNRFNPVAFNAAELDKAVNALAAVAQKVGGLGSQAQADAYKRKLKEDASFRNSEWEKFRAQKKIEARKLAVNTQLHSNKFSYQYITKVQDGYVRNFDNGRIERFNEEGKLVKVSDKNGNFVMFTYGRDGKLQKIVDNMNRKMFFTFNNRGFLEKIQGENGKEATYRYNELGELAYSKDVDGNTYTYKYDSSKRHNMLEIGYSDKTTMQMAYYPLDKKEHIKSVKDRDGTVTEYTYDGDVNDKSKIQVGIVVKGSDGKPISSSRYEYYIKRKADGEEWTYKMVQVLDGERTETTYNECCGLPMMIKRGAEETTFEYDRKGHVTKKATPTEVTELTYDPKASKVSRVMKYSKTDKARKSWATFQYDDRGNLVFAKNSEGKGVKLFYDGVGRIKSMVDQNRRRIDFKYNENSKPIEITDPALGSITVAYTNSGEIKKVDSTAGRKIAMQVTSAFQNLLDIIRPAGVNLSF
jgi:YD repeat-containing protein